MSNQLPENSDLAWDLDEFAQAQRAMEFVRQFESTLCVFSPSVEQIYSNYNMYFPEDWDRKLVILPDAGAFHDTFSTLIRLLSLPLAYISFPASLLTALACTWPMSMPTATWAHGRFLLKLG